MIGECIYYMYMCSSVIKEYMQQEGTDSLHDNQLVFDALLDKTLQLKRLALIFYVKRSHMISLEFLCQSALNTDFSLYCSTQSTLL